MRANAVKDIGEPAVLTGVGDAKVLLRAMFKKFSWRQRGTPLTLPDRMALPGENSGTQVPASWMGSQAILGL
jgi:hypothetical protein